MRYLKNQVIQGTLILTIAGFITRLIGFVYRVYLSDTIGSRLLGVYQLIFPVYGICFTIYASGIQTAISQKIASITEDSDASVIKRHKKEWSFCLAFSRICSVFFRLLLCRSDCKPSVTRKKLYGLFKDSLHSFSFLWNFSLYQRIFLWKKRSKIPSCLTDR